MRAEIVTLVLPQLRPAEPEDCSYALAEYSGESYSAFWYFEIIVRFFFWMFMQLVVVSSWYLVIVFSSAHLIFQGSFDNVVKD